MAVLSLLLAIVSLLLALAGFVLTVIPYAGVICSVLSVLSAVAGIVIGARAHSQAKEAGDDTTLPVVAMVMNVFMFLGSLCLLATCGACNALMTSSGGRSGSFMVAGPDGSVQMYRFGDDAGVQVMPDPFAAPTPAPTNGTEAPQPAPSGTPSAPSNAEGAPPPALPPPPMNEAQAPTR